MRISSNDSVAELSVSDTGEGISKKFLPLIFDRFQQADASITRKHGGLGLGLAITRHLVEMHGGTIEAESAGEGRGATFKVRLPLTAAAPAELSVSSLDAPAPPPVFAPAGTPNLSGIRVLAIDDVEDTRVLLRFVLEQYGAAVTTASSARDALEVLAGWKPDVIVCDIGMPGEDGYSFIQKVRKMRAQQGGNTPAVGTYRLCSRRGPHARAGSRLPDVRT